MPEAAGRSHPLDRAVWNALTTRRADLAVGDAKALRLRAEVGPFVASADDSVGSLEALAELVATGETVAMVEAAKWPIPRGFVVASRATLVQMVACAPAFISADADADADIVVLTAADAPAMVALAVLTRPGPFRAGTPLFGGFLGIKREGMLIAMAGTRLSLPGFVEVSAVCTHPDHRGHGLAAHLIGAVADAIRGGGDTPFLTSYADNAVAIALYEKLGFRVRGEPVLTMIERR